MSPGAKIGVYVALMRGVNVGGKNRLPMKDLAAIFAGAGCADVVTYIQSGNVVFRATDACAARVPAAVAKAVADRFAFRSPVVMRSAAELRAVARGNPYRKAGADVDALHVLFLADCPAAARVAELDPHRSPPDEFQVRGREVYLRCPNGVGRSKLTVGYFDSKLSTTSTLRNWRTVLKLVEMSGAAGDPRR
jgi:uncharacterized protein (DUF1697 family)